MSYGKHMDHADAAAFIERMRTLGATRVVIASGHVEVEWAGAPAGLVPVEIQHHPEARPETPEERAERLERLKYAHVGG